MIKIVRCDGRLKIFARNVVQCKLFFMIVIFQWLFNEGTDVMEVSVAECWAVAVIDIFMTVQ